MVATAQILLAAPAATHASAISGPRKIAKDKLKDMSPACLSQLTQVRLTVPQIGEWVGRACVAMTSHNWGVDWASMRGDYFESLGSGLGEHAL